MVAGGVSYVVELQLVAVERVVSAVLALPVLGHDVPAALLVVTARAQSFRGGNVRRPELIGPLVA